MAADRARDLGVADAMASAELNKNAYRDPSNPAVQIAQNNAGLYEYAGRVGELNPDQAQVALNQVDANQDGVPDAYDPADEEALRWAFDNEEKETLRSQQILNKLKEKYGFAPKRPRVKA